MSIRIGANPIGWSNDDLRELGGNIPLEQCLTEAEAGFEGMELGHKFPREAGALKKVLSAHDLDLVSGWYSAELLTRDVDHELKALRPHLDLLKAMGCNVLVFAETSNAIHGDVTKPLASRPVLKDWKQFGERVTGIAEATLAEGVRLVFHHHMGTIVQSAEDIDALMRSTGEAAHLLLDTGHATWAGADPIDLAKRYRKRISHFHAKDLRPAIAKKAAAENWSFLTAVKAGVYTVPGDGSVDFTAVLKELPGYSGWMVVEAEQDPEKANPLTYAKMGFRNLQSAARAAGHKV